MQRVVKVILGPYHEHVQCKVLKDSQLRNSASSSTFRERLCSWGVLLPKYCLPFPFPAVLSFPCPIRPLRADIVCLLHLSHSLELLPGIPDLLEIKLDAGIHVVPTRGPAQYRNALLFESCLPVMLVRACRDAPCVQHPTWLYPIVLTRVLVLLTHSSCHFHIVLGLLHSFFLPQVSL